MMRDEVREFKKEQFPLAGERGTRQMMKQLGPSETVTSDFLNAKLQSLLNDPNQRRADNIRLTPSEVNLLRESGIHATGDEAKSFTPITDPIFYEHLKSSPEFSIGPNPVTFPIREFYLDTEALFPGKQLAQDALTIANKRYVRSVEPNPLVRGEHDVMAMIGKEKGAQQFHEETKAATLDNPHVKTAINRWAKAKIFARLNQLQHKPQEHVSYVSA